jgi:hypothetical protein
MSLTFFIFFTKNHGLVAFILAHNSSLIFTPPLPRPGVCSASSRTASDTALETLLVIVRLAGFRLRRDDPVGLRDVIVALQASAAARRDAAEGGKGFEWWHHDWV